METIQILADQIRECQKCPLHQTRDKAVPGEGPPNAEIMMIAEGPGFNEDRQGKPFVGPAGTFLDQLLVEAKLKRADVFITNIIKCRAPNNRDPVPNEVSACTPWLDQQVEAIKPRLIVTMGRFATERFLPGETISKVRGRLRRRFGLNIYPVIHPAAGLRRNDMRQNVIQDFRNIPQVMKDLSRPTDDDMETPSSQPNLF